MTQVSGRPISTPILSIILTAALLSASPGAHSQPALGGTPPESAQNARSAEPTRVLILQAGYLGNLLRGQQDKSYYHVEYKGKLLTERGAPFQVGHANLIADDSKPLPDPGGDTHNLSLKLERGSLSGLGDIFDTLGVQSLHLPALRNLRGVLQISGLSNLRQLNLAGGIESPPINPLSFLNRRPAPKKDGAANAAPAVAGGAQQKKKRNTNGGISNFVVFGLMGERENQEASAGGNKDVALATYRGFVGQTYGWTKSRQAEKVGDALAADMLKAAKSYKDAVAWLANNPPPDGQLPDHVQTALNFVTTELKREGKTNVAGEEWADAVHRFARAYSATRTELPTAALWLESSGWYTLSGSPNVRRLQNVLAATLTYWLDPNSPNDLKLQFRYENGFERAAPTARQHYFVVSLGANF